MVRVNGKKFTVYNLDNLETFKNRLAISLSTLPEYLYFPAGVSYEDIIKKKGNITVQNILDEIKTSAKDNSDLIDLIDSIKTRFGTKYNIRDRVVHVWIAYNKKLATKVKKQGDFALEKISNDLMDKKIFITQSQFRRAWKERSFFKKQLESDLRSRQERVKEMTDLFNRFRQIEESSAYTEFQIEYIQFILTLDIQDMSILELFNAVILNESVPFATTKDFYKILKDFIPPEEWSETREDMMVIKVNQKKYLTSSKPSNYSDAIVKVDEDGVVTSEVTINTYKGNVSRDVFIKRSIEVFSIGNESIKVQNMEESKVVGVFYYPMLTLDKYVFADLVMNNDIFSNLISIDDHERATKKKPGVYIHFYHPSTGYITATVTEKKMIKGDITMKDEDTDLFPVGEPFIRVRISKADNTKSVQTFQEMFGKLLNLYDAEYNDIVADYRKYIPDFGTVEVEDEREEKELSNSDIAPDIFVTNYTRNCKPDRMPTIATEEEAIQAEGDGRSVMKFPRDDPDDPGAFKFPMDGEDQRYYVCDHEKYKYVGLKVNKLKNADLYPYVPCCFLVDQSNKPNHLHYFTGSQPEKKNDKKQPVIITDKFLTHKQFGRLPPNIESLFTLINPSQRYEEARKGMIQVKRKKRLRNEHSFLDCVMEALDDETNILSIEDPDEREAILIDTRNKLATEILTPLCRQEMYDYSVEEIIAMLRDPTVYLDPKLFIHLLEDYFECNIFLFTKKILDGEMTLPRHVQGYYKNRNRWRCVYIYEHMGSESDHATYPQCELIIRYDTISGESVYSFSYEEAINVRKIFGQLRKSYALDKVIKEGFFPLPSSTKVVSQWIDSYGKTRILNINFSEGTVSLIISPMQPIRAKESESSEIHRIDVDTAIELANYLKMNIDSQTVIGGRSKEISGIIGNILVSIPINDSDPLERIPEKQHGLSFPEEQESALTRYNRNKKLARYIVEYMLWVYSHYLQDNSIENITDESIANFARDYFKIVPDYDYGYIPKTFSADTSVMDGEQIVVQSEEMSKRLVYVLRLLSSRNSDGVFQYYNKKVIQNYYEDVTDFRKYKNQVILYGEESIEKWISENNIKYVLHNEVKIGTSTPYFFKNDLVGDKVYLAQNTTSLGKASDIAITWVREDYNIGIHAEEADPVTFTLYSYVNGGKITPLEIKGKAFSHEVKILGYKLDDRPFYTTLLPLS
jgi:hypothetical protein